MPIHHNWGHSSPGFWWMTIPMEKTAEYLTQRKYKKCNYGKLWAREKG